MLLQARVVVDLWTDWLILYGEVALLLATITCYVLSFLVFFDYVNAEL